MWKTVFCIKSPFFQRYTNLKSPAINKQLGFLEIGSFVATAIQSVFNTGCCQKKDFVLVFYLTKSIFMQLQFLFIKLFLEAMYYSCDRFMATFEA